MSLPRDLLEQARRLATLEPRRPRQASLRRSISTAYYALFHLLVEEAARRLAPRAELWQSLARAFEHAEMRGAAEGFATGRPPEGLAQGSAVPADLQHVARAFIDLQQARHEADYDLRRRFTRADVLDIVDGTGDAFDAWSRVRKTPSADAFVVALLLRRRLSR